jgi:CPA2 family monovalent cation:H+ antiporter-2
LQDLAVVMIVAGLVTVLFHRLKQPVVLGYILAGVIIGPHTPPFVLIQDQHTIQNMSELGIILLMFSLGMEFNLRKLREVGVTALFGAGLEIIFMLGAGYFAGRMFGWNHMDSLFLGAMLSISSTTIIIKALNELGLAKEKFAGMIFGILIIEDILAIVMLALLSGIAMTGSLTLGEVGLTVGKLSIFLVTALVLGLIAVPRLLGYVAKFKSNEMLLVTALALCFGFSLLAAKLGYSVALGAFVIGALISEAREIHKIEHLMEPIRDMFSAIFFVSIGLLIDPKMLITYAGPIAIISVLVIAGKVLSCGLGTFAAGNDVRTSLRVGMGLSQIGEFSFIIAALGLQLKVTSEFLYPIAVAVSAITTLTTPYLIKSTDAAVRLFDRKAPKPLLDTLELYTKWAGQLGETRKDSLARKFIRKWMLQVFLNVALICAVFITAVFFGRTQPNWLPAMLQDDAAYKSALWITAVIVALPLFIAAFRKLQALGLLIADLKVKEASAGTRTEAIRSIVAQGIPLGGLIGLFMLGLSLSTPLLPPLRIFIVLLVLAGLLTFLLWRSAIKIYSKAQYALHETLNQPPVERHAPEAAAKPGLLREADLQAITLVEGTAVIGKLIRETGLRKETGASIVGIDRNGNPIINPEPDEELRAGDQILLLGTTAQLEAAQKFLARSTVTT